MTGLYDSWQRQVNYLRISVTDHCNLSCVYCATGPTPRLPRSEMLSYEEIERVVRVAAGTGISKVRLTGGEPLLRADLDRLVEMIARIPGIDDIALTTNGMLLAEQAERLKKAGLQRVNVSLDTLQPEKFRQITCHGSLEKVLSGIEAAHRVGLEPVKLNVVVLQGINDDETLDFARMTVTEGWHVRFIEFMPFGMPEGLGTVSVREIVEKMHSLGEMEPYHGKTGNGPARYFRLPGAKGTLGFISPVTEHFCASCNRLRLTPDGQLRPCLLDEDEVDLKEALRCGAGDDELEKLIRQAVNIKREHHRLAERRGPGKRPMYRIGG